MALAPAPPEVVIPPQALLEFRRRYVHSENGAGEGMTDTGVVDTSPGESPANARMRAEVEDALDLANYVVSSGIKDSSGQLLLFADIAIIQGTASLLGLIDVKPAPGSPPPSGLTIADWNAFELAYYRLASTLS